MSSPEDIFQEALRSVEPKPPDEASSDQKRRYSQRISEVAARGLAKILIDRGMTGIRPGDRGDGASGVERRMSGGIGAKKVDVSWATEECGLLFAASIKTINFRDRRTGNFQKNLTNRRGDLLFESVTLHRRFPYAVLAGFFLLDRHAAEDGTDQRQSTFVNAHDRLQLFTGRDDPADREEQYERLYVRLIDAEADPVHLKLYLAGRTDEAVPFASIVDELVSLVAKRNPDFYQERRGRLNPV